MLFVNLTLSILILTIACSNSPNDSPITHGIATSLPTYVPNNTKNTDMSSSSVSSRKNVPPDRDLYDIARRLGNTFESPSSADIKRVKQHYPEGHEQAFWILDHTNQKAYSIRATLMVVSEHAYWYVDKDVFIKHDDLVKAATSYEKTIYPTVTKFFGDIWGPGIDNEPRLTILHTRLYGSALGYFSPNDEYPRQIRPLSNQRKMIYMDTRWQKPGSQSYLSVLAHELQHAVHWNIDQGEDAWVNEGLSELAVELSGFRTFHIDSFLKKADVSLNFRPETATNSSPYYGAANLFFAYLTQHYGGNKRIKELILEQADSITGIERYLSSFETNFLMVYKDWLVANYVNEQSGLYGYRDREIKTQDVQLVDSFRKITQVLPQFSASYTDIRIAEGDTLITFNGESSVKQVNTECYSGRFCWWSNHGDGIDSSMTREFDLTGLTEATLIFWTWFEIEKHWDYGYVSISIDGGNTWTNIEGEYTTNENPLGNNFGNGITGRSNIWVEEKFNLSSFVGRNVLIRFDYITDGAVYSDGLVIDDISIPQLGFFDNAEKNQGWKSEGFQRIGNAIPQKYVVRLIVKEYNETYSVREVIIPESGQLEFIIEDFGTLIEHAVLIVSPVTRDTHQSVQYTLIIEPWGE